MINRSETTERWTILLVGSIPEIQNQMIRPLVRSKMLSNEVGTLCGHFGSSPVYLPQSVRFRRLSKKVVAAAPPKVSAYCGRIGLVQQTTRIGLTTHSFVQIAGPCFSFSFFLKNMLLKNQNSKTLQIFSFISISGRSHKLFRESLPSIPCPTGYGMDVKRALGTVHKISGGP